MIPISYASFWGRLGAYLIDTLILFIVSFILDQIFNEVISIIIALLLNWLYFAYCESSVRQATPGKQLLGLKVIDEAGERISFGTATKRFFSKIISSLILLIGFLMVLWDEERQGLHDKIAHTYVVTQ